MAHGIISGAPMVVGVCEPRNRKKMADYIFRVSRELLGRRDRRSVAFFRHEGRSRAALDTNQGPAQAINRHGLPAWAKARAAASLLKLLDTADLGDRTFSYGLPDHLRSAGRQGGEPRACQPPS